MSTNAPSETDGLSIVPLESSAVALIREAIQNKADPAQLRELLAVRREWEADEARKAYNLALADFQRRAPIVEKLDTADGKKYAALDRIWREVRPLLTELGLSVTWLVVELRGWNQEANTSGGSSAVCHLEGSVRHKLGHGEKLVFDLPLPKRIMTKDGRDVQNAAQQMGSATSYGRRYATCLALGVVTGEDDDGTTAGEDHKISADKVAYLKEQIRETSSNEVKFMEIAGVKSLEDVMASNYPTLVRMLAAKVKNR